MTQAPEIARPETGHVDSDLSEDARRTAKGKAQAAVLLAGHHTGIDGREQEFLRAMTDVLRTFDHTQGYEHEVNDSLVKMWLSSLRFARKYDLVEEYVAESVAVMDPILQRMKGIIETSGERDVALEAICGWSTCHHQLVLTETHKAPGRRWFLSPFERVLDAGTRVGQFDFDETWVVEQFYIPRAYGFAEVMGVEIDASWDRESRIITISIVD